MTNREYLRSLNDYDLADEIIDRGLEISRKKIVEWLGARYEGGKKQKNIFLVMGESGSGKDTITKELSNKYGLKVLKSYTTRPKRYDDEDTHIFISEEEFDKLENICAFTVFDGHRYACTQEQADDADLYIIDPAGVDFFMNTYKGERTPIVVYIDVDEKTRFMRMQLRGDTFEGAQRRIEHDRKTFAKAKDMADIVVKNNVLNDAIFNFYAFILALDGDRCPWYSSDGDMCRSCKHGIKDEGCVYCDAKGFSVFRRRK